MQHYSDIILFKTHQHILVPIFKFFSVFIPYTVGILVGNFIFKWSSFLSLGLIIIGAFSIFAWYYFFWVKSYFIISNEKIIVKVRNGLFSKFHMSIHYKNIRDTAFSKNNIFHYLFNYGTFFARSSAGAVGDLEAKAIPHIEKVYKIVNYLHNLTEQERREIRSLDDMNQNITITSSPIVRENGGEVGQKTGTPETLSEATQKEKQTLLDIQGIKEVVELTDTDRRFIFEHEEDRNHGVYECLRRQVLFAATHDSTLRDPDEAIVMQAGKKGCISSSRVSGNPEKEGFFQFSRNRGPGVSHTEI